MNRSTFKPFLEVLENRELLNADPLTQTEPIQTEQESSVAEVANLLDTKTETQENSEKGIHSMEPSELLAHQFELAKERARIEKIVDDAAKEQERLVKEIAEVEKSITDLESKLEKGQEQGFVSYWAAPFSKRVRMDYRNIPEGTLVQVANRGRVYMSLEVNTEATKMMFNIPSVRGVWAYPNMQLFHPDHGVLEGSKETFGTSHGNPYRGIRANHHHLTVGSGYDEEAIKADLALSQKNLEDLKGELETVKSELKDSNGSLNDSQEKLRESIPYSSMLVSDTVGSAKNSIPIRYRTNLDEVTFRIKDSTNVWQKNVRHVGGVADGRIHLDVAEIHMGNQMHDKSKPYKLEMLDKDENLLDVITVLSGGRVVGEQPEWEDLETGFIRENPVFPDIQIAAINGTAIVAAASTPYDDVCLSVEGGGIMSSRRLEQEGGTELVLAQMFFNGSNSSGEYDVRISNSKGILLDSETVVWNGEELTLKNADSRWTPDTQMVGIIARGDEAVSELEQSIIQATGTVNVFASQTGLKTTNMDDYPHIREFQENELARLSKFHVSREELDEAYFNRYPDMRNETNDQMIRMRNDALGALWDCLHVYHGAVGRILKKAVDVYFVSQRGGDQQAALEAVQKEREIWGTPRKIAELEIETGIKLPTVNEAMAEALRIYEQNTGAFYVMQDMQTQEHDKQEYHAISRYWQIVHAGQPDGPAGSVIAGIGESVAGINGASGTEAERPMSRSEARAITKWKESIERYESGGYGDPRIRNYVDNVKGKENVQRDRWIEKVNALFTVASADMPEEETPPSGPVKNPLKPDINWAVEQIASLERVVDVVVEGKKVEERIETERIVENAIKERVKERLNERLQSMTIEERANTRGLLRLQEDGRLDEYLVALLSGSNVAEANETDVASNQYSIYYLIDTEAVLGAGHAAMIMGSENEGWYFFSFGVGTSDQGRISRFLTSNGNMEFDYFPTLTEAMESTNRYDRYLRWNVPQVSSIRSAFRQASSHLSTNFNLFKENCDDIASNIIRSAGIELNDAWIPVNTFNENLEECDEVGDWIVP